MTEAAAVPATPAAADRPKHPLADAWVLVIVVLAAWQPFTAFALTNASRLVDPGPVVLLALGWSALLVGAFLAVRLATRRCPPLPVAASVAAANMAFWNYGRLFPSDPGSPAVRWVSLGLWLLLTALLIALAWRVARASWARPFLVGMLSLWVVGGVVQAVVVRTQAGKGDHPVTYTRVLPAFAQRPDVYWFVLDEHPRTDQLEQITGVSNAWFGEGLAARGFSVSESSRSAYLETHLSIPSTLAMDYWVTPGGSYPGIYLDAADVMAGHNPVFEAFVANGYRIVYAPDGSLEWAACPGDAGVVVCVDPVQATTGLREPYSALLTSTPVGAFGLPMTHNTVQSVVDGFEELRQQDHAPTFFFAHLLTPHFPHRYEPDCSRRSEWVLGTSLTGEERAAHHAVDTLCVDAEMLAAIDRILLTDPDAVVIVQSDHGSRLTFNFSTTYEEMSPRSLREGYSVLNAIRLPGECRGRSIEGEPLVNTFRLVFGCLTGTEPELLAPRSFFAEFGRPDTLIEVPEDVFYAEQR